MKKIFYIVLNLLVLTPINVLAADCESKLGTSFYGDLQYVYTAIRVSVPILVVILSMKDMITAVAAGKADDMKKAQSSMIKRIVIGIIIFLVPTIINYLLYLVGINSCPLWE